MHIRSSFHRAALAGGIFLSPLAFAGTVQAGTPPLTPYLVKDIKPGPDTSFADFFTLYNGAAYFRADDGTHGFELWRSDGTAAGTYMVTDIKPGAGHGFPVNLATAGGFLYFSANDETTGAKLWRTDGTAAGTVMIKDVSPGANWGGFFSPPQPDYFTEAAGTVFFRAHNPEFGQELWKTDGTAGGTVLVKDIHPGPIDSIPVGLTSFAGRLYFAADDSVVFNNGLATFDRELWVSDGTEAGTVRVKDINPGPEPSIPSMLTVMGDSLYFRAADGTSGTELWKSDGTEAGTVRVADINPGSGSSSIQGLRAINDTLYFSATDGTTGEQLWRSDGTAAGTQLLKVINPGGDSWARDFTAVAGDRFVFAADDGVHGIELWVSDGTEAGTSLLRDINPGSTNSSPLHFTSWNDQVAFFVTISPIDGEPTVISSLWMSDGTADGTQMLFQSPGKDWGYEIDNLLVVGDTLLFMAPAGVDGNGFSINRELHAIVIPEPAGALALAGLAGLAMRRRRV